MTAVLAPVYEDNYANAGFSGRHELSLAVNDALSGGSGKEIPGTATAEVVPLKVNGGDLRRSVNNLQHQSQSGSQFALSNLSAIRQNWVKQSKTLVLAGEQVLLRVALFVLAALVVIFLGMLLGLFLEANSFVFPAQYLMHTVMPGDTLWSVAGENAGKIPTEDMVALMMEVNSLDTAALNVGQQIVIPVF